MQKVPRYAGEQGLLTPGAFRFQWSTSVGDFPGSPSSCPSHYRRAFGYYAASALCPARWHVRVPVGSSSCRVPQFRVSVFAQPVACLLDAGCLVEEPSLMCKQAGTYTVTILVKCLSRFHLSDFTTLPTQVSLVSIGRRGSPCLCFGSKTSVHYLWASHPEECHSSTHATSPSHRSPDGPFQATRSPVKGRTTHKSI